MSPDQPHLPRPLADIDSTVSEHASRWWWDHDADDYHDEHGDFLGAARLGGEFRWCPEGLTEAEAALLGPVEGRSVLEVGCGSAPCARWLTARGAHVIGLDLSREMLRHGLDAIAGDDAPTPSSRRPPSRYRSPTPRSTSRSPRSARYPSSPIRRSQWARWRASCGPAGGGCSRSIIRCGGCFPDDPGPAGLTVSIPYFSRTPYRETDDDGNVTYVEHHRTIGDRVREIVGQTDPRRHPEPEWPDGFEKRGQWSPLRGSYFPGTAIFCSQKPG